MLRKLLLTGHLIKNTNDAGRSIHKKELLDLFSQLLPDTQDYLLIMAKELLKMQQKILKCASPHEDDTNGKES